MISSLLLALATHGPSVQRLDELREELRPLLNALAVVESNGNDHVKDGDGGRAIGRYQIWRVYWQDAVGFAPSIGGTYQDVRSKEYAERVVVAYLLRYAKKALAEGNYEKLARIHNGGPKGDKRTLTEKYWNRVKSVYVCPFCGGNCLTFSGVDVSY